jgi:hypothetical protein
MRKTLALSLLVGLSLVAVPAARADVWDVQTQSDNDTGTQNELVQGSDQLHDLGALPGPLADADWFRISQQPWSSYEIVADATSGDIGTAVNLELIAADGTTVLQSSAPIGIGYSRSLRFVNATGSAVNDQYVRVTSASCTTSCGPDDVYRLRAYETTYSISRFNNFQTQLSALLVQNPSAYTITGNIYLWQGPGNLITAVPFSLIPKQTFVLNTDAIAHGLAGSITVSNDGRYGDLSGKAVALEPATGFSFDSPMEARPH